MAGMPAWLPPLPAQGDLVARERAVAPPQTLMGEFIWAVTVPLAAAVFMVTVFVVRSRQRP